MLSALQQGSLVHIIDKTNGIKYLTGEVLNRTDPVLDYSSGNFGVNGSMFFDLTVKVNDENYEFKHLNSTLTVANNGNIIISETKESLSPIVENIFQSSKKVIDPKNIEYHTEVAKSCEDILKKLNPVFAREKERDTRIKNLEDKVGSMGGKLDSIISLLSNQNKN